MPLPPRTLAALVAVADRLDRAGVPWLLAGGAGRALQGAAHRPADIDVEVSAEHADVAARALGFALTRDSGGGMTSLRAGGAIADTWVDLSAGIAVTGRLEADWALQWAWAVPCSAGGRTVMAAPVEEALARAIVRGDWARIARLAAGGGPPPRPDYLARRLSSAISNATL